MPRSTSWHRSEQNGRKRFCCDISTGFLQIGHITFDTLLNCDSALRPESASRASASLRTRDYLIKLRFGPPARIGFALLVPPERSASLEKLPDGSKHRNADLKERLEAAFIRTN